MRRILLLTIIIALSLPMLGASIDEATAKQLAQNFWKENNIMGMRGDIVFKKRMDEAKFVNVAQRCGYTEFFIFNNENGKGFVIIAADDCVTPILGYSYDNNFAAENLPPNLKDWLDGYAEQIRMAVEMRATVTDEIRTDWECLRLGRNLPIRSETSISPLITTFWNQNYPYNNQCPEDPNANGYPTYGHTYAGCVATAMAQIMKYWSYPDQGFGFHQYNHPSYGQLSANFGETTYNWSSMPNDSSNNEVARLLYHCGVSVEMNYGPNSSGARILSYNGHYEYCSENALKTFFGYKSSLHGVFKNNHTDTQWINLLKNELNHFRPVLYAGATPNTNNAHAFVCDGYNANNYFHFNWGWSGAGQGSNNDAYYYINNLNPENHNYSSNQQALIGIEPNSATYNFNLVYRDDLVMSKPNYCFFDDISVYAEILNNGSGAFNGYIGAGVFVEADNDYLFLGILDQWDRTSNPLATNWYTYGNLEGAGGPPYIPGSYKIIMLYSLDGNYWNFIDKDIYSDGYFDINYSSSIETQSDFSILTGDESRLYQNTVATINVDVKNTGDETFYGQFRISLSDYMGGWMQTVDVFDCTNGLQPNQHYTNGIDFTGIITVEPGNYLLSLAYKESGSSNWYYAGATEYQNPIWVYVAPESIFADPYEPNNTQNLAYSIIPSFSGNSATVNTTGSNLHNSSDVDYYKINLDSGYDYTITPILHDAYYSGNGNTYSAEARFAYSTDGANWSNFFWGDLAGSIMIEDGGTIYFDVTPFEGDIGTYLLSVGITRTQHIYSYTISVSASPTNGGTVTGGGTYQQGQQCTVTATANSGYNFINWTKNGAQISSNPTYTFTVTETATYVAHFSIQSYTVTTSSSPSNGGTTTGGGSYNYGQTCTVTASAANGYAFTNWTENGTQVSTNTYYTFTVTGNRTLTANFELKTLEVTASADPIEAANITGTGSYLFGEEVTLTVIPDEDWAFINWTENDEVVSEELTYTFLVIRDRNLIAHFQYTEGNSENSVSAKVYPNPTQSEVTVECENLSHVRIVNAYGQTVYDTDIDGNQVRIDLSQMDKGIYMMHIEAEGGQAVRKIVVE